LIIIEGSAWFGHFGILITILQMADPQKAVEEYGAADI
jgi:hypothetical protein